MKNTFFRRSSPSRDGRTRPAAPTCPGLSWPAGHKGDTTCSFQRLIGKDGQTGWFLVAGDKERRRDIVCALDQKARRMQSRRASVSCRKDLQFAVPDASGKLCCLCLCLCLWLNPQLVCEHRAAGLVLGQSLGAPAAAGQQAHDLAASRFIPRFQVHLVSSGRRTDRARRTGDER